MISTSNILCIESGLLFPSDVPREFPSYSKLIFPITILTPSNTAVITAGI